MNEIREIVTKAVVGKGRKIIRLKDQVSPSNDPFSVLGCWVINHEFEAVIQDNIVHLSGQFEINIWYAFDNNSRTEVARKYLTYHETIKTRQLVKDVIGEDRDVIVRIQQAPTCTNASIAESSIAVDIVLEVMAEIIGETKMKVTVFAPIETIDAIDDDFENEINENFINTH